MTGIIKKSQKTSDHQRKAVQLVLDDLEKGGWLGKNEEEARKTGWYEYNRQLLLKQKKQAGYQMYMLNWLYFSQPSLLFPGKKHLSRNYPFVLKYPLLIPFAWIHRIIFRGFAFLRRKTWQKFIVRNEDDITEEGKARFAMFQRLEML